MKRAILTVFALVVVSGIADARSDKIDEKAIVEGLKGAMDASCGPRSPQKACPADVKLVPNGTPKEAPLASGEACVTANVVFKGAEGKKEDLTGGAKAGDYSDWGGNRVNSGTTTEVYIVEGQGAETTVEISDTVTGPCSKIKAGQDVHLLKTTCNKGLMDGFSDYFNTDDSDSFDVEKWQPEKNLYLIWKPRCYGQQIALVDVPGHVLGQRGTVEFRTRFYSSSTDKAKCENRYCEQLWRIDLDTVSTDIKYRPYVKDPPACTKN